MLAGSQHGAGQQVLCDPIRFRGHHCWYECCGDAETCELCLLVVFCCLLSVAAYAKDAIPYFKDGVRAVARSMPTSAALDLVARDLGITLFEVPTGMACEFTMVLYLYQ